MGVSSFLVCSFIVLHNAYDLRSREFVESLPKDFPKNCIVNWHDDPMSRFAYDGPPPSAFPSVVLHRENGYYALVRTPGKVEEVLGWKDSPGSPSGFESITQPGIYVGGLKIWEAQNLVRWGYPTKMEERAILAGLARNGHPISTAELKLARLRRPKFRNGDDFASCKRKSSTQQDGWNRLDKVRDCLAQSANLQVTQLLVSNLAARDPELFAKKLGEAARKQDLAKFLSRALESPLSSAELAVLP